MEQHAHKQYYISLRGEQVGPFTLDELVHQPVRRKTLVWSEDEWLWVRAARMAELAERFRWGSLLNRFRKSVPWRWITPVVSAVARPSEEGQATQFESLLTGADPHRLGGAYRASH